MDREPDKNSSLIVLTKKIAIYIKLKKKIPGLILIFSLQLKWLT